MSAREFQERGGWPEILGKLFRREDLEAADTAVAFGEILEGSAEPSQIAAFVAALRTKGETVEEIGGFLDAMLAHGDRVETDLDTIDTCGTGGDRSGTINVSTAAALVCAGAGVAVCKHGNRAASSEAGSADVLEALGVAIALGPAGVVRCLDEAKIGFCFAPRFYPTMRHAASVRRELGVATIFNILGPLANPARARRQVIGVGDANVAEKMIEVLEHRGALRAMVLYGHDGLDELSTVAPSTIFEIERSEDGTVARRRYEIDARSLGLRGASLEELRGGDPMRNAEEIRTVLAGDEGAKREIVLLNAAAAFVVAGWAADLAEGIEQASSSIDSGAAANALAQLVESSNRALADGLG